VILTIEEGGLDEEISSNTTVVVRDVEQVVESGINDMIVAGSKGDTEIWI